MCQRFDFANCRLIDFLLVLGKALPYATPSARPTVENDCHVCFATTDREGVHKHLCCFDLCCPTRLAKASTAIDEKNDIDCLVASQKRESRASCKLASFHVALLVLQALQIPITWTFAVSFSWRLDELLALLGAAVTILGACAPLGPIAEFTILFACLSIASHCLGGSTAFLSPILGSDFHFTQSLRNTASALGTALAPSTPSRQFAVHWAWLIVAAFHGGQWQALGSSIRVSKNVSGEFLLAASALLSALLWIPLGHLAILKERGVATAFHLVELSANLLQGAQLSLEIDVVGAASFHLFLQIVV
jgi:hypothetical protein